MSVVTDKANRKAPGELIRATDWNDLVEAVEAVVVSVAELSSKVDTRLTAVEGRVTALEARADAAAAALDDLRTDLGAVQQQFRRVTLRTDRVSFALGEPALIRARVADLFGAPLVDLADVARRPWVDFVTTWGQLRPVPGFTSLGGEGDRTLSVRVDPQGEARALLAAENAGWLPTETEEEVAEALTTLLPSNADRSVAETILRAATPLEATVKGAFRALSTEYDRADATSVRQFVDAYFIKDPVRASGQFAPALQHGWHDYRATVLALAKADSDPTTADSSLGSSSIQVTFRDWILSWIALDYLADLNSLADRYRDRLSPKIDKDYRGSASRLKDEVAAIVRDKGLVAKQRDYQALSEALGRIKVADPPAFFNDLTASVRHAVTLQQAIETAQAGVLGPGGPIVAFEAFADTTIRAQAGTTATRDELTKQIQQQLDQVQDRFRNQVRQEQETFKDDLLREDGPIASVHKELRDISGRVNGFQEALGRKADVSLLGRFLPADR